MLLNLPRRTEIYAIVRTGGKQYRVEAEQVVDVDRLQVEVGSTVELRDVLMLSGSGRAMIGTPNVNGAQVLAEVVEHGRDAKIMVFKYKNKTRYRRRHGHRQDFTRLAIREITIDGEPTEKPTEEKPKRAVRKRAPVAEAAAEATAAVAAPVVEAAAEAKVAPAPRRSRKAAAPKPKAKAAAETAGEEATEE
jgi:large subunit ribosomal protein L21